MSSRRPIGPAFLAAVFVLVCGAAGVLGDCYPLHVGFMWPMHQPVYYPYESIIETEAAQRSTFSVIDVHNQRFRPCTTWPRAAVPAGLGLPHLGVQLPPSVNGDGNVNAAEYAAFEWRAVDDMNCDAMPDFGDINAFVALLTGGG
jgi:hypothetical protein